LILDDIETCQYVSLMKRHTDADVLLLQGAADPTRLAILRQLAASHEVCACDFSDCCSVGQPTVSHHLKVLRESGWVTSERRGSWIYYRIRPEAHARFGTLVGELQPGNGRLSPDSSARRLPVIQPG
jgi:ArsR family transcriptional regulator, arsenate/arsenite/antimonite-responsive transcriptional repressor